MICELADSYGFVWTYVIITLLATVSVLFMSFCLFFWLYMNPTYDTWKHKDNPEYPTPAKVRWEILQTIKSVCFSTIIPVLSFWMAGKGYSKAHCGITDGRWSQEGTNFLIVWIISDFWEFLYHWCGHYFTSGWIVHKHHHVFFNPSPFAVIADEPIDQIMRSLPLLVFPVIMPLNIDILLAQFSLFFYVYGLVLHSGFEFEHIIDAHHPIVNTAFQHYYHHAASTRNKPYHCGFFLKCWDQLFGSLYPNEGDEEKCVCVKCCVKRGERSREIYEKIEKPDYYKMFDFKFWIKPGNVKAH